MTINTELGWFRESCALVKDKNRKYTVCIALPHDYKHDRVVRKKLRVRLGDVVSLHTAGEFKYGKMIHCLPVEDGFELDGFNGSLFVKCTKPYFQDNYSVSNLHRDNFSVPVFDPVKLKVEFTFCMSYTTVINCSLKL